MNQAADSGIQPKEQAKTESLQEPERTSKNMPPCKTVGRVLPVPVRGLGVTAGYAQKWIEQGFGQIVSW